jgi:hypothetical protein
MCDEFLNSLQDHNTQKQHSTGQTTAAQSRESRI